MSLEYVIDRIEGDAAVLIDKGSKRPRDVKASELPAGSDAGDTVIDECGSWSVDVADSEARADAIRDKMLFSRRACLHAQHGIDACVYA